MSGVRYHLLAMLLAGVLAFALPATAHAVTDSQGILGDFGGLTYAPAFQAASNDALSENWAMLDVGTAGIRTVDESYVAYYTGAPVRPVTNVGISNPSVQGGYSPLLGAGEFSAVYHNNVSPSSAGSLAKVTVVKRSVSGISHLTRHFIIKKHDLANAAEVFINPIGDQIQTGSALTPQVSVASRISGAVFSEGSDYALSYANNVEAGLGYVTVTSLPGAQSRLSGQAVLTFRITAPGTQPSVSGNVWDSCSLWSVGAVTPVPTYTGLPICPKPAISYNGALLSEGVDYKLEYRDNVNAGIGYIDIVPYQRDAATLAVSERRDLARSIPFSILPASLDAIDVSGVQAQAYTGFSIIPEISASYNGTKLSAGTDYVVSASDNLLPGTATIRLVPASANFYGAKSLTFQILEPGSSLPSISEARVTAPDMPYAQGKAVKSVPTVTLGSTVLKSGDDYTTSYVYQSPGYAAGDVVVTVTGCGNYSGTASGKFTITQLDLSKAKVTVKGDAAANELPATTVTLDNVVLEKDVDYTLARERSSDGATAIVVTGKGNYTGRVEKTLSAQGNRVLTKDKTEVTFAAATYTGGAVTPQAKVVFGGRRLVAGTDYVINYSDNVKAGTAKATLFGIGEYSGKLEATFKISPASIASGSVEVDDVVSTGKPMTPKPTVVSNRRILAEGSDYSVSYSNNVDVGTAKLTVTGKGNYTGTKSATFRIARSDISTAQLSEIKAQKYTGEALTPEPKVTLGGVTLKKGTDYTLSYKNNVNAGTATVTVTGKGNYAGTKSGKFTISGGDNLSLATVAKIPNQTYTGKAITPEPKVTCGGKVLKKGTDYFFKYSNNVNAGTATLTVTGIGHYSGAKDEKFAISPAKLSSAQFSKVNDVVRTKAVLAKQTAYKPAVSLSVGGKALKSGDDYTLAYSNNTSAGTATITAMGKGNYTGSAKTTFKIETAAFTVKFKPRTGDKSTKLRVQSIPVGEQVKLAANKYTKPGYVFMGWNTQKNGKGKSYSNKQKVKNLAKAGETVILYAQWKSRGQIAADAAIEARETAKNAGGERYRKLLYGDKTPGDTSWCSEFGVWCLYQGGARFGKGIMSKSYVRNVLKQSSSKWSYSWMHPCYYRDNPKQGTVYKADGKYKPQPGDLIIYVNSKHSSSTKHLSDAHMSSMNHTRVCIGSNEKTFSYIGGNEGGIGKGSSSYANTSAAYFIHVKWENVK